MITQEKMMKCRSQLMLFIPMLTLLGLMVSPSFAQISKGGTPPSFAAENVTFSALSASTIPIIEAPVTFDVEQLRKEDSFNESYGHPPRVAINIPLSVNLIEDGVWTTLPTGQKVCRIGIYAPRALAISLMYSDFYIPKGGELFIYNKEKTHILGAYTNATNLLGGIFATELVAGDELVLEYVSPADQGTIEEPVVGSSAFTSKSPSAEKIKATPRILISGLAYGYNHLPDKSEYTLFNLNSSGACHVNINCEPEGADWQKEKNGIARIFYPKNGSYYYCSGTLLNNTDEDLTGLILSAFHCFNGCSAEELKQAIFLFHYEQAGCRNLATEPGGTQSLVGATLLVNMNLNGESDGSLVELTSQIPEDYNLYWNGWDRRNIGLTSGVGIHHPKGDVMKISTITSPAVDGTWIGSETGGVNAHWKLNFTLTANGFGIVEEGSSGSGLFNQDHRVVGSLTGGSNVDCSNPAAQYAFYGKLWYHWDQDLDPNNQMKKYLDPNNKGNEYIDGRFFTGGVSPNFRATQTTVYASEEVQFIDMSYSANSWYWEFPGGSPAISTAQNPTVTYSTPGSYTVNLTVNKGDSENERIKVRSNYITVKQKTTTCDAEDIIVGNGSTGSDFPLGGANKQTYSVSLYTLDEGFFRYGTISSLSWNAGSASDAERTVRVYLKDTDVTTLTADTWENEINGATLVYDTTGTYQNAGGWVKIDLKTPYVLSGMKNLKVLIHTIVSGSTETSSSCYYSVAAGKHLQWTAADESPIAGNGTVNNNRPDIKFSFAAGECSYPPVADFEMMGGACFSESFDEEYIPASWTVEKPGASESEWMAGNVVANPFAAIDPTDKYSAAINYDGSKIVDSWLKSNKISLPVETNILEFYAGYNCQFLYSAQLMCYISTDNTNWTQLWTTGNVSSAPLWSWYKIIVDISAYKNQDVYLAWRYYGRGGDIAAIDNIRIYENKDVINLYEGETLRLIDKSTGPPVYWQWTLPGGTPATSSEKDLMASYFSAGTYDVNLKVRNNLGENTKTNTNALVVTARPPISRFVAQGGYTRMSDNNRFIPKGGQLLYLNKADHVPTSWNWVFEGGSPANSTEPDSIKVTYATKGDYNTKLTVTNSKGSNDSTATNIVRVGNTDTIWNMKGGEKTAMIYSLGDGGKNGYVTGTNDYKVMAYAERFVKPLCPVQISSVNIMFAVGNVKTGNLIVDLCSDNGGFPGDILASKNLPVSQIIDGDYTTVTFPQKIGVATAFHIVVRGFNTLSSKVGILSSAIRLSESTTSVYFSNAWYNIYDFAPGVYISLNIAPELTYTELEISDENINVAFDDNTDKTITITGNTTWSASVNQSWLKLKTTEGTAGASQLTFACDINSVGSRNAVIQLQGGGVKYKIFVEQDSGDHIANLKGALLADQLSVKLTWGDAANTTMASATALALPVAATSYADEDQPVSTPVALNPSDNKTLEAAQALRWDNGIPYISIGYAVPKTCQYASLFYPEEISNYNGGTITAIEFFPFNAAEYTLLIYQNEVLKLEKPISASNIIFGALNRIDISTENITLDATKTLRFGFRVKMNAGAYPLGAAAGPAVVGKGDLISNDDGITWLSYKAAYNYELNWILAAYVKKDAEQSYYRLYRDDKMLAETDAISYIDWTLTPNKYCYKVTKVNKKTDMESPTSNIVCVDVKPVITVTVLNGTLEYGDDLPTSEEIGQHYVTSGWKDNDDPGTIVTKWPTFRVREDLTSRSPIGVYPGALIGEGAESNSHNFAYIYGQLTIARRKIEVAAVAKSNIYGNPDGELSYVVSKKHSQTGEILPALIGGETLSGSLSRTGSNNVGVYDILQGSLTDANNPHYTITKYTPAKFTINKRPVSIKTQAAEKFYGDSDPVLKYTLENGIGEVLGGTLFRKAGEDAGIYPITRGTITDVKNPNYAITFIPESLTIKPRLVQVTANTVQKNYGDKDPKFTYTVSGLVEGDVLKGSLTRKAGEDVGNYAILQNDLAANKNPNYAISYIGSSLQIVPKEIIVTADAKNKYYGESDPKLTYSITSGSLKNGDMLIGTLTREQGEDVRSYKITQGNLMAGNNYNMQFIPSTFAVLPAPLFVKANDLNINPGNPLPQPTYTMTGYYPQDELALRVMIDDLIYVNARPNPPSGVYDILFRENEFTNPNYAATFSDARLTVKDNANKVTAFIPGSTGGNARFMPEAVKLQVFNLNGYLIYDGSGNWDGIMKDGKMAQPGVYYYVATLSGGSMQKGSVEVYKY